MNKGLTLAALSALALLAACRKNTKEAPRDYDGVRARSEEQHKSLDSQSR